MRAIRKDEHVESIVTFDLFGWYISPRVGFVSDETYGRSETPIRKCMLEWNVKCKSIVCVTNVSNPRRKKTASPIPAESHVAVCMPAASKEAI
jgi:hypothetical protein